MKASNKSEQVLTKEEYPEPKTKAGFPALIREVLDMPGGILRIVMEKDQPVRVWRWIDKGDLEESDPTLDGALANAEIIEYINPDPVKTAPEELFHMMAILQKESHIPVCWATGRALGGLMSRWLRIEEQGVPFEGTELFGLPIERLKSLPEDTLLLCGAKHVGAGPGDVTVAIKVAMELREARHGEEERERNAVGVGHPPEERSGTAREAEAVAGGDSGSGWNPPSFLRARFERCTQVRRGPAKPAG